MGAQFCPDCGLSGFAPRWGEGKRPARCVQCGWEGDLGEVVMFTPEDSFWKSVDERIKQKKDGKLFFLRVKNCAKDKAKIMRELQELFGAKGANECQNGDVLLHLQKRPAKSLLAQGYDVACATGFELI